MTELALQGVSAGDKALGMIFQFSDAISAESKDSGGNFAEG
jgi:hypothetical protein